MERVPVRRTFTVLTLNLGRDSRGTKRGIFFEELGDKNFKSFKVSKFVRLKIIMSIIPLSLDALTQ